MENSTWDGEVREAEAAENTTDEVDSENTECESESAVIDIEDIESEEYRKSEENAEGSDTETGRTQQSRLNPYRYKIRKVRQPRLQS